MSEAGDGPLSFSELWAELLPVGRDAETGGYRRYSWTEADAGCRAWFTRTAARAGLRTDCDRAGNLWAWWDRPGTDGSGAAGGEVGTEVGGEAGPLAVVTGSHLDSVPDGGAYDGPLGVVAGFAAVSRLRSQGFRPARPVAVAAFTEEEGARFGVACLGSRLLTGEIEPPAARELRDADGISLAQAMTAAGRDAALIGPDDALLARIGVYVELHIEQGCALTGLGAAVGVADGIWPHGRWRFDFVGRADHAGTTRLGDRRDPMLPFAATALAAREAAARCGALATIGKVVADPGAANAISAQVLAWLDARAPDEQVLDRVISKVTAAAQESAARHGVTAQMRRESFMPGVRFDAGLRDRMARVVGSAATSGIGGDAPLLATGAGHDAGILAGRVPAGMLFVRNPTGVSHSPAEHADAADCEAGVAALTAVLADLAAQ